MIESFRHKGLQSLYEHNSSKGINSAHERKIKQILAFLESANTIDDLNYVSLKLHPLKGNLRDFWSVSVNGNWRIIFKFENGIVSDVDLIDYH